MTDSNEFRGLAHVVDVWRAGNRNQRDMVGGIFPALAMILVQADAYVLEIEMQEAAGVATVNEAAPARHPNVAVLDAMLNDVPRNLSQLYGPGDWLNLALNLAAQAIEEGTPTVELAFLFTRLADTTIAVEQHDDWRKEVKHGD